MTKFWGVAGAVSIIGLIAVFSTLGGSNSLQVNDLETECRYDRGEETRIQLNPDNSLSFTGHFPIQNVNTDLDYSYSGGNNIVLNVKSQDRQVPDTFWNNCLASVVYDLDTQSLEPGRYPVAVKHNGEEVEKIVVRVKN